MNYHNNFKELHPLATVEKIKQFFENRNYKVFVSNIIHSEIDTWSCHILLQYNSNIVLQSNGKGMTKEYCLASGYAELYERFCNQETIKDNIFFRWKSLNYKEIKLNNYEELIIDNRLKGLINPEDQKTYFETFSLIGCNAISYFDLQTNQEYLFQENVLDMFYGSVGMAAGNTLEEALNQSLSELCEKEVCHQFYYNPITNFYSLNLNNITNSFLKDIINNIQKLNYDIYVFDLSYNYGYPVLMSLLIDKNNYTMRVNFGAFPVFDIALERILTELYQGIYSYHMITNQELQLPYKTHEAPFVLTEYANSITQAPFFNEEFLNQSTVVEEFNKSVFLFDNQQTNQEILYYYKNLFKNKNLSVYFKDNSLDKDIKAVHCFCPEFICFDPVVINNDRSSSLVKQANVLASYLYLEIAFLFMNNTDNNFIIKKIADLFQFLDNNNVDLFLLSALIGREFLYPLKYGARESLRYYLSELPSLNADSFKGTIFYSIAREYAFIQNYRKNNYSTSDIKEIFVTIFNKEINDEDILNCFNQKYLLEKIYIEPMKEFIHSSEYEEYVKTYYN